MWCACFGAGSAYRCVQSVVLVPGGAHRTTEGGTALNDRNSTYTCQRLAVVLVPSSLPPRAADVLQDFSGKG
jgi:hypothetical protein